MMLLSTTNILYLQKAHFGTVTFNQKLFCFIATTCFLMIILWSSSNDSCMLIIKFQICNIPFNSRVRWRPWWFRAIGGKTTWTGSIDQSWVSRDVDDQWCSTSQIVYFINTCSNNMLINNMLINVDFKWV